MKKNNQWHVTLGQDGKYADVCSCAPCTHDGYCELITISPTEPRNPEPRVPGSQSDLFTEKEPTDHASLFKRHPFSAMRSYVYYSINASSCGISVILEFLVVATIFIFCQLF